MLWRKFCVSHKQKILELVVFLLVFVRRWVSVFWPKFDVRKCVVFWRRGRTYKGYLFRKRRYFIKVAFSLRKQSVLFKLFCSFSSAFFIFLSVYAHLILFYGSIFASRLTFCNMKLIPGCKTKFNCYDWVNSNWVLPDSWLNFYRICLTLNELCTCRLVAVSKANVHIASTRFCFSNGQLKQLH